MKDNRPETAIEFINLLDEFYTKLPLVREIYQMYDNDLQRGYALAIKQNLRDTIVYAKNALAVPAR